MAQGFTNNISVPVPVAKGGTGLTSTTINRILYSSANNVIAEITTGNNGILITSSGGVPSISSTLPNAVLANITKPTTQIFTSGSGTYTTPANVTYIRVRVWGGGGGGGALTASGGGGGGGGGYCESIINSPAASYTYAVAASAAGASVSGNAGTAGNTSTFSAGSMSATGGAAGSGTNATGTVSPGGTGSNGNILNLSGQPGQLMYSNTAVVNGGNGGMAGQGGGGGTGAQSQIAGGNGTVPGGGGGGGGGNVGTWAGGSGAAGLIIVEEFYA